MASQRDMFLAREADAFFARERAVGTRLENRIDADLILAALRSHPIEPQRVLEIGASDGWRLDALRRQDERIVTTGIDPSRGALVDGARRYPKVRLACATAECLPFASRSFDLVILGFFLYVVDRDDLFRIAAEVDRVIMESGVVAILDFHSDTAVRRPYRDTLGCYSYKMDYAAMFDWNPVYRRIHQTFSTHPGGREENPADRISVTLLRRDPENAYMDQTIG